MIQSFTLKNGLWFALGGLLLFMSLNYHAKAKPFTYQSQIWSDKAGYNIYLPLLFIYGNDASALPDSIVQKTGEGFSIDTSNNTVVTKYTSGVAILQTPFFLTAHFLAKISGDETTGFSSKYQKTIDFASVFYCVLGLFLLYKILVKRHSKKLASISLIAVLFGSNLLYYSIDETGMSHVYSFFLFALFLYLLDKTAFLHKSSWRQLVFIGLTLGLITLIRPINLLIFSAYFFWDLNPSNSLKDRFSRLFQFKTTILLSLSFILVLIPQLIYWKISFGDWFVYSYGKETFDFLHPEFLTVLFSAKQGVFIYGTILLLSVIWSVRLALQKNTNGIFYTILFLLIAYITASWHDPSFGCSFGARNLVEYQAVFVMPLLAFFNFIQQKKKGLQIVFSALMTVLIAINVLMVYGYGGCSLVSSHWDFGQMVDLMDL